MRFWRRATTIPALLGAASTCLADPLPGTEPLDWEGDIASRMVDAADAFLLEQIDAAVATRKARRGVPDRERLKHILGIRDARVEKPQLLRGRLLQRHEKYEVRTFRLPAFGGVGVEGLVLEPANKPGAPSMIYLPDPDAFVSTTAPQTLAANGYQVFVPVLIDRAARHRQISNREFLYRSAFELGRHLIGYEVQKVSALVDAAGGAGAEVRVAGDGEGGLIALHAAATDERIDRAWVIGHFGPRERVWDEPAYRNVFGLLNAFGDAEVARLVSPRKLVIDPRSAPEVIVPTGTGGKPGRVPKFTQGQVAAEAGRAGLKLGDLADFLGHPPAPFDPPLLPTEELAAMQTRAFDEIDQHNQALLADSAQVRRQFFAKLDNSSLERFEATIEPYREHFAEKVIGRFDLPLADAKPRTRLIKETATLRYYEVVLDVFGGEVGLFAYGILVVPKDIEAEEMRPVVVCQHGLEGRPQSTIGEQDHRYYKAFATSLAERGFVTFAPQNLYIFKDRFRALQFKANAIGRTLFSLMVPQHQQITDWLGGLDFVDEKRIAFYGLSYGGKSAMRIPPLVSNYCLSICSADFNEWVWKNASTRAKHSYVWTGEYEIFEWDLGGTFNYAEMAALIAPRPFMVERGHFDGVAPDETVAYEYAKVRHLYAAKLGIPERTEIEWFVGPHSINGKASFEFLHRHLEWPER